MVRISQTISFFVDFTIYLLLVGVVSIVFSQVIPLPTPYNQMNYMSPLYCNIMLIFARFYAYYLREVCSTKKNFKDYLEPFLYINSFVFITHLIFGFHTPRLRIPSLLSLDYRYIWFPIASYLIFFSLASIITLVMNYIEKKRSQSCDEKV